MLPANEVDAVGQSFQVRPTPRDRPPWPPSLPSVPTSRALARHFEANALTGPQSGDWVPLLEALAAHIHRDLAAKVAARDRRRAGSMLRTFGVWRLPRMALNLSVGPSRSRVDAWDYRLARELAVGCRFARDARHFTQMRAAGPPCVDCFLELQDLAAARRPVIFLGQAAVGAANRDSAMLRT